VLRPQLDLLVLDAAHARFADLHAAAAEGHLAVLLAVPLRAAIVVVLAFRSSQPGHLGLKQLLDDGQSNTNRQR
jgi:hypothetical protein